MFEVELSINHRGCWGSEINVKFPNHQFSSVDCRWVRGQVVHILLARGDKSKFQSIIDYLTKRKDVSKIEILSQDEQSLYLRVITKRIKKVGHFSDIFFEHHCFPVAPTRFEKTSEIWTLGTAYKKNITNIYTQLKRKIFNKD